MLLEEEEEETAHPCRDYDGKGQPECESALRNGNGVPLCFYKNNKGKKIKKNSMLLEEEEEETAHPCRDYDGKGQPECESALRNGNGGPLCFYKNNKCKKIKKNSMLLEEEEEETAHPC